MGAGGAVHGTRFSSVPGFAAAHPGVALEIVATADGFDAATSKRSYQSVPWPPDKVLAEMRDNPKRGYDPLLVKAFPSASSSRRAPSPRPASSPQAASSRP